MATTDNTVKLVIAGAVAGNNKAVAGSWPGIAQEQEYGSTYDKWGTTPTENEVNGADFGFVISADLTNGDTASGEYVRFETWYTTSEILPVYTAELGAFPLGAAPLGGGTASSTPQTVTHFDEDRGQLFFHGGAYSTQVDPADMEAVDAFVHEAAVRGAADWRNRGYVGLGPTAPMQRRVAVTLTGSTYEDVEISGSPIYTGPLVTGPDRLWLVDVDNEDEYALRFSLTALTSWSGRFLVGDPGVAATGLGTYGRSALVGAETGAYGFTDLGIPVRVLESLRGQRSPYNSQDIITMWGWTYITTSQGLKATIPGQVENPAGLPRSFEGKPQGLPTAIWPYKDALFMAVKDVDGDAYILRGEFGLQTGGSGQPDWYPFCVIPEETVDMIASTAQRPVDGLQPSSTLLMGIGSNAGYVILGRTERDIDDPDYLFTTGSDLTWTGTTMLRSSNMHKNIKYFVLLCEDLTNPDQIQVQVKVDNGDYVNVGSAVTTAGHKFVRPVTAGVPQTDVNGHTYKPRLVVNSTQTQEPVKIRGTLDMVYDERPDEIWEHVFYVQLGQNRDLKKDIEELREFLAPHHSGSPLEFRYPGEARVRYGFVVRVDAVEDMKGDGVQGAAVTIQEWDVA